MTAKTFLLAAALLATTTFNSGAQAGGIRLSMGGPLGNFTAHPHLSSGPGGTGAKRHSSPHCRPRAIARSTHEEPPVHHAYRAAPKVEVAEEAPTPRKSKRQRAIFGMARVTRLDKDNARVADRQHTRKPRQILRRIKQDTQWRIADGPALFLPDLIIEEPQRIAVADDQDGHARLILEPDFARPLELELPAKGFARTIRLREIGGHGGDRAQVRLDSGKIGQRRRNGLGKSRGHEG